MPFDNPAQSQLEERRGTNSHVLLWLIARNRDTGAVESIGFWTGDDHRDFTIGGDVRTYFGAGDVLDVSPVDAGVGEEVVYHRISLPPLVDEVRQALRVYDARLARVEVHVAPLDIDSGLPFTPVRMIKGVLAEAPETLGEQGGDSAVELNIASAARLGTFGLPLYRSDAQTRRRSATDRFREYVDTTGAWVVPWGEKAKNDNDGPSLPGMFGGGS